VKRDLKLREQAKEKIDNLQECDFLGQGIRRKVYFFNEDYVIKIESMKEQEVSEYRYMDEEICELSQELEKEFKNDSINNKKYLSFIKILQLKPSISSIKFFIEDCDDPKV